MGKPRSTKRKSNHKGAPRKPPQVNNNNDPNNNNNTGEEVNVELPACLQTILSFQYISLLPPQGEEVSGPNTTTNNNNSALLAGLEEALEDFSHFITHQSKQVWQWKAPSLESSSHFLLHCGLVERLIEIIINLPLSLSSLGAASSSSSTFRGIQRDIVYVKIGALHVLRHLCQMKEVHLNNNNSNKNKTMGDAIADYLMSFDQKAPNTSITQLISLEIEGIWNLISEAKQSEITSFLFQTDNNNNNDGYNPTKTFFSLIQLLNEFILFIAVLCESQEDFVLQFSSCQCLMPHADHNGPVSTLQHMFTIMEQVTNTVYSNINAATSTSNHNNTEGASMNYFYHYYHILFSADSNTEDPNNNNNNKAELYYYKVKETELLSTLMVSLGETLSVISEENDAVKRLLHPKNTSTTTNGTLAFLNHVVQATEIKHWMAQQTDGVEDANNGREIHSLALQAAATTVRTLYQRLTLLTLHIQTLLYYTSPPGSLEGTLRLCLPLLLPLLYDPQRPHETALYTLWKRALLLVLQSQANEEEDQEVLRRMEEAPSLGLAPPPNSTANNNSCHNNVIELKLQESVETLKVKQAAVKLLHDLINDVCELNPGGEDDDDEKSFSRNPLSTVLLQEFRVLFYVGEMLRTVLQIDSTAPDGSINPSDIMTHPQHSFDARTLLYDLQGGEEVAALMTHKEIPLLQHHLLSIETSLFSITSTLLLMLPLSLFIPAVESASPSLFRSIMESIQTRFNILILRQSQSTEERGQQGDGEEVLWVHLESLTQCAWTLLRKEPQLYATSGCPNLLQVLPTDMDSFTRLYWEKKPFLLHSPSQSGGGGDDEFHYMFSLLQACVTSVSLLAVILYRTYRSTPAGGHEALSFVQSATQFSLTVLRQTTLAAEYCRLHQIALPFFHQPTDASSSSSFLIDGGFLTQFPLPTDPTLLPSWTQHVLFFDHCCTLKAEAANTLIDLYSDDNDVLDRQLYGPLEVEKGLTLFLSALRQYEKKRVATAKAVKRQYSVSTLRDLLPQVGAGTWEEVRENLSAFIPYKQQNMK